MRRILLAAGLFAFGVLLPAQQDPDFTAGMKEADAAMEKIRKLETKTGLAVLAPAEDLGAVYEEMIPFWRQRNASKAVRISEEGKAAAVILASAANAGNAEKAAAAFKQLGDTCRACHEQYREKIADEKYRIKQQ